MTGLGKKDAATLDHFMVMDAGGNLVTGLVQGDFTIQLYNPSGTDVSGSISVTIAELASGNYTATFTPNATGAWLLVLTQATYFPWGKRASYLVFNDLFDADAPNWAVNGQSNITATRSGNDVAVSWDAVVVVTGVNAEYELEYKIGEAGSWATVAWTDGTALTAYDLTAGSTYIFRVKTYAVAYLHPNRGASDTATVAMPADTVPSVSAEATATAVTATVSGGSALTHRVKLQDLAGATEDTKTLSGTGDVTLTPTSAGRKFVLVWSTDYSEPTATEVTVPSSDETPTVAWYRVTRIDRLPGSPYRVLYVERVERPIEV